MISIRFGTSGWRGVIADDFTFANVRIVAQAIADFVKETNGKSIIIGFDTRFLSEDFANVTAEIFAYNQIAVFLSKYDLPTPVIAYEIIKKGTDGGVNFTASHNDYIYNGLKFSTKSGGPALPEETQKIEFNIDKIISEKCEIKGMPLEEAIRKSIVTVFDKTDYSSELAKLIDFDIIKDSHLKIIYEPFFGTGRRFLPGMLQNFTDFKMIHATRDPLFNKMHPEPLEKNLIDLKNEVVKASADLGISTDGDADRFGFIDRDGSFLSPDKILSIIYYYLLSERKLLGNVVRTLATTHMLDRIAKDYGFKALETPVGFKYIGDALIKKEAIFGGEESGGASITGWLPEKDGILIALLVTEILSKRKKSLKELHKEVTAKYGEMHSGRLDFPFVGDKSTIEDSIRKKIHKLIQDNYLEKFDEVDGIRATFKDGGWMLFRFSGTEPKIRIYFESPLKKSLDRIKNLGELIFEQSTIGG